VTWLWEEFYECPPDVDEATVTLYAKDWVWHMFANVLFSNDMGDAVSWMYIPILADWDEAGSYSWGSAVLAYLYHQLCESSRRRRQNSSVGGCVYLLHVSLTTSFYFLFHLF
jgi:hypothetical protein